MGYNKHSCGMKTYRWNDHRHTLENVTSEYTEARAPNWSDWSSSISSEYKRMSPTEWGDWSSSDSVWNYPDSEDVLTGRSSNHQDSSYSLSNSYDSNVSDNISKFSDDVAISWSLDKREKRKRKPKWYLEKVKVYNKPSPKKSRCICM